jgi:hypothetical protein
MFDLNLLKTRLEVQLVYPVTFCKVNARTLQEYTDLPQVEVGYFNLNPHGNFSTANASSDFDYIEQLVQVVETHIICTMSDLPTVWRNVYKAVSGWSPSAAEDPFSGLMFRGGGIAGLDNGRVKHIDRWAVKFDADAHFN